MEEKIELPVQNVETWIFPTLRYKIVREKPKYSLFAFITRNEYGELDMDSDATIFKTVKFKVYRKQENMENVEWEEIGQIVRERDAAVHLHGDIEKIKKRLKEVIQYFSQEETIYLKEYLENFAFISQLTGLKPMIVVKDADC